MAQILVLDGGVRKTSSLSLGLDGTSFDLGAAAGVITLGGGAGNSTLSLGGDLALNSKSFTGAAVFADGVTITGNLTVNGTTTTVNSTIMEVDDNIALVNAGPSGSANAGYAAQRYQAANDVGTGDVVTDANALVATIADIGDQTGMTNVQVKLAGGSATNDYYTGMWLKSAGDNVRLVTEYNGISNIATVASAWTTQPADTEAVSIYSPFHGLVYDETNDVWVVAHLTGRLGGDAVLDALPLRVGTLAADDLATLTGGAMLPDSVSITIGTGSDFAIQHDGTNTVATSATGELRFDNVAVASDIVMMLGADTTATGFVVKNNSGNELLRVNGDGTMIPKGGATMITGGGDFSIGGGMAGGLLHLFANNADQVIVGNGSMYPSADSTVTLGTSAAAFSAAYVDTITSLDANDRVKLGTDAQVLLSLPVFTTQEITDNIAVPAAGDLLYDSTTSTLKYRTGAAWVSLEASGGATLDGAYNGGVGITVDNGAVALTQAKTTENVGTLSIVYAASAFTGTSNGIVVDLSNATSFNNAGDIYGVKLTGATNAGAGASVGLSISGFDAGIENAGTLAQSGVTTFTGNVGQTTGTFTYNVGASAFSVDGASFSIDSTSASNVSVTGGNLTLSTLTSGTLVLDSVGLVDLNAGANLDIDVTGTVDILSSGVFSIDGTGNSNVSATSGSLTLSTITSGTLALTSAGALNLSAAAASTYGIVDNSATSLVIGESTNAYLTLDTTDGAEVISFGNATTNQKVKIVGSGGLVVGQTGAAAAPFAVHFDTPAVHAAVDVGSVVYIDADGKVQLADADAAANSQVAGVALDASALDTASTIRVALFGKIASGAGGGAWTSGATLYLSTTDGQITATAPSGSGDVVLPMGIAIGASSLLLRVGEPIILP